MKNKRLGKSLNRFYQKKENVTETLYGELGIPLNGVKTVDVPGRLGYVYVRLRGNASELVQAYNTTVPSRYDYPVIVSRKGNKYSIVGRDQSKFGSMGNSGNNYTTINYTPMPNHGGQHSFNPELGMGADPTWIYGKQFMPNLMYPSGTSMLLAINPSMYEWNGSWKYPSGSTTPDLTPYKPTITGSAKMVLLYMEGNTGIIKAAGGVGFSGGINNHAELAQYIPDVDRNQNIPLAAVKLETGTSSIQWSNIYDVRDFYTVAKYFQGIGIQDSTTPKGTGTILNFGNNLSVTMSGNIATIDATAGGGGGIGIMGWDEGVPLGTGTILNFVGGNVDASISGSVIRVFVTGSASSTVEPPVTGSLVFWDEGVLKGSATVLNVVSEVADVSISGSVARLFITGSASTSLPLFTGTATYFRVAQPSPLSSTTGTYWKTPEPYVTGSLTVFNQGHVLIPNTDFSEQYPQSGTYQYTVAQETGTYHLSAYGIQSSSFVQQSTGTSGGGITHEYLGYNTVGGSTENMTQRRVYAKKITVSSAGILSSIGAHVIGASSDQVSSLSWCLLNDNSGTPNQILSYVINPSQSLLPDNASGAGGLTARWIDMPCGVYLAPGDYWIAVMSLESALLAIYYDGSGSDRYYTSGGNWFSDWGWYSPTTSSNQYSIRASLIN